MKVTTAAFAECLRRLNGLFAPTEAENWMLARQPLLNGQTPAELIKAGKADDVLRAIDQLADGVYL